MQPQPRVVMVKTTPNTGVQMQPYPAATPQYAPSGVASAPSAPTATPYASTVAQPYSTNSGGGVAQYSAVQPNAPPQYVQPNAPPPPAYGADISPGGPGAGETEGGATHY